jgi:UDP-MurNAc hydroxylase
MKVDFVNHASFILEHAGTRVMCDPWLEGTAFNDGWALLSDTAMPYSAFGDVDYIWFSHEHPDHFSPPTLKHIAPEHRATITVLYQATDDGKVTSYCRNQGFKAVIELVPGERFRLGPDLEMEIGTWPGYSDSWSCLRSSEGVVLNLNDCAVISEADVAAIRERVGPIDVLFTQFSISAWDGNLDEHDRRHQGARTMLRRVSMQCDVLRPKYVVPFASYIWFCHEENFYMNEAFLPIEEVARTLNERCVSTPIFLYPGDIWEPGTPHDSDAAIERYAAELSSLGDRPRVQPPLISRDELMQSSKAFVDSMLDGADASRLRVHLVRNNRRWLHQREASPSLRQEVSTLLSTLRLHVDPARVYVSDHGQGYLFDPFEGLVPSNFSEEHCDISVGSQSLQYSFRHLWGGDAMHINGRFHRVSPRGRGLLFHMYSLASNRNAGARHTWSEVADRLVHRIRDRIS